MGRATAKKSSLKNAPLLPFSANELTESDSTRLRNRKGLDCPLWTQNKAKLIREYIRLFTLVTKHGAYIDGFAAPQRRDHEDQCSARLVLENEPQWIREFWLCDLDPKGAAFLRTLQSKHETRRRKIHVLEGDFNRRVDEILDSGAIKESTATFALLDQRTFECEWSTVERLAAHKKGTKIELFYFFPTGWIDRSIAAVKAPDTISVVQRWWGKNDWQSLQGQQSIERANLVASRFTQELGYRWAIPFAIHNAARNGRTMYHMIHATDHDDAPSLMLRAYRKVSGLSDWDRPTTQMDIEEFLAQTSL